MTALAEIVDWLICPVCQSGLRPVGKALGCASGHSFDIARQGYVNLTRKGTPANADTTMMVAARERFLDRGHYRPIADAVTRRLGHSSRLLEVGAGTGYYLAAALDAMSGGFGVATDVSPAACRRAARTHDRLAAIVADTWEGLPLRPCAVDAILCVFAPRNPAEFFRTLTPGGVLVVVTPESDHLASLRAAHQLLDVRADKLSELRRSLTGFDPISTEHLGYTFDLDASGVEDLIGMGPNAFHQTARCPASAVIEVSVQVSCFRKPQPV